MTNSVIPACSYSASDLPQSNESKYKKKIQELEEELNVAKTKFSEASHSILQKDELIQSLEVKNKDREEAIKRLTITLGI